MILSPKPGLLLLASVAAVVTVSKAEVTPFQVECFRENFDEADCKIADIVISAEIHACVSEYDPRLKEVPHHVMPEESSTGRRELSSRADMIEEAAAAKKKNLNMRRKLPPGGSSCYDEATCMCKNTPACQEAYCQNTCDNDPQTCEQCQNRRRNMGEDDTEFEAAMLDQNQHRNLASYKSHPDALDKHCHPKMKDLAQELLDNGINCLGDPNKLWCDFAVFERTAR